MTTPYRIPGGRRALLLTGLALLAVALPGKLRAQTAVSPTYRVVNLGTLPTRAISRATAISNTGIICGDAWTNKLDKNGNLYSSARSFRVVPTTDASGNQVWYQDANGDGINDLMQDVGTFGGDYASAFAVNDAGDVVGQAATKVGYQRAFWFHNGTLVDLLGRNNSGAMGITSEPNPRIVGGANGTAFQWQNGKASSLPFSAAVGINSSGQIAGASGGNVVLWSGGQLYTVFASTYSNPTTAISSTGSILINDQNRIWVPTVPNGTSGSIVDMGALGGAGGTGNGVNSFGQVVGSAKTASGASHAYLWDSTTGIQDLNALVDGSGAGWVLGRGRGINDRGWIVGEGTLNGVYRAFLLLPL